MQLRFLVALALATCLGNRGDSVWAQIGGGSVNPGGSLGAGSGGGLRGRAVNPNFHPPGSLSPFRRFNPPGSTSPALNLNPPGSVFRPRPGARSSQRSSRPLSDGSREPSPAAPAHSAWSNAYRLPTIPSPQQFRLMDRERLWNWARWSARQLEVDFSRFENGDEWSRALRLSQVQETLSSRQPLELSDQQRENLRTTLERCNHLVADPQYAPVTDLAGFTALRRSLGQLLSGPAPDGEG